MNPAKFSSRKFIVTMTGMFLTAWLAYETKMTVEVATVMTTAIVGYHLVNGYVTGKGNNAYAGKG